MRIFDFSIKLEYNYYYTELSLIPFFSSFFFLTICLWLPVVSCALLEEKQSADWNELEAQCVKTTKNVFQFLFRWLHRSIFQQNKLKQNKNHVGNFSFVNTTKFQWSPNIQIWNDWFQCYGSTWQNSIASCMLLRTFWSCQVSVILPYFVKWDLCVILVHYGEEK